ncbi:MAG TPA: DsbA family protein [Acidimicrobiia bacterium]|nr:DsbA family protein [Acidimicrobiia bacterium]
MQVSFYIDPICPWCWITSRWMTDVATDRDLEVIFKPFSLAIKNDLMDPNSTSEYAPVARETHRILRVMEAVRKAHGNEGVAKLYSEVGHKIHNQGEKTFEWMSFVLDSLGFDTSLLEAGDDESYDEAINAFMEEAFEVCGTDIGTPVLRLESEDGPRGFFGPVISELPEHEEGLALWDGISAMISFPNFFELKRTRDVGPDIASTERLFEN